MMKVYILWFISNLFLLISLAFTPLVFFYFFIAMYSGDFFIPTLVFLSIPLLTLWVIERAKKKNNRLVINLALIIPTILGFFSALTAIGIKQFG